MPTLQHEISGASSSDHVSYWGPGALGLTVTEPFDAMNGIQCERALHEAEAADGPVNVLKVGFWDPRNPEGADPNEVVVDFTDARQKSNIGVVRNPRAARTNFGFRVADSHWGVLLVYSSDSTEIAAMFFFHLGLKCVMPERPGGKSVFETALAWCDEQGIKISDADLFTDGGVQQCCYAHPNVDTLRQQVAARYGDGLANGGELFPPEVVVNPPHTGHFSISLPELIRGEFRRTWCAREDNAYSQSYGDTCTACYGFYAAQDPSRRLLY